MKAKKCQVSVDDKIFNFIFFEDSEDSEPLFQQDMEDIVDLPDTEELINDAYQERSDDDDDDENNDDFYEEDEELDSAAKKEAMAEAKLLINFKDLERIEGQRVSLAQAKRVKTEQIVQNNFNSLLVWWAQNKGVSIHKVAVNGIPKGDPYYEAYLVLKNKLKKFRDTRDNEKIVGAETLGWNDEDDEDEEEEEKKPAKKSGKKRILQKRRRLLQKNKVARITVSQKPSLFLQWSKLKMKAVLNQARKRARKRTRRQKVLLQKLLNNKKDLKHSHKVLQFLTLQ